MSRIVKVNQSDYKLQVKSGGTITLDVGNSPGRVVVAGNLSLVGSILNGSWQGSTVSVPYGGTGATALTGYIKGNNTAAMTAVATIPNTDVSGLGTISTQDSNNVTITGGTANGLIIGNVTPAAATFSTLQVNSTLSMAGSTGVIGQVLASNGNSAPTWQYISVDPANSTVANVLYVSKSGSDSSTGTSLITSKLTIKAALAVATYGTTIFVKSGDYTENNPMTVPQGVAIVGDSLRTVTVRPANKTQDMFWVNNAVYLAHMTFKDHESPSSAVTFNPDGSAGVIHTSPYVQNCTSMTTTGTGMRVDGAHVNGLRSMVVDAFTQYNQGGIGIHMLNRGNAQLVSVFTICCQVGFLCEAGGFCSITNSNSSFGIYALKSDGVSSALYTGKINGAATGRTFTIDNLTTRPNVGDAVKFAGDETYYTLASSTPFTSAGTVIAMPSYADESAGARNLRQTVLDGKSKIQADTIDLLNDSYLNFDYNEFKCTRDVGLIIDAVVDDMMFSTNYKSIQAGISYTRATASLVIGGQLTETLYAVNFVKTSVLALMTAGAERTRVSNNFDLILAIMAGGTTPSYTWASPTNVNVNKPKAQTIIQANRNFIIEEGIAYITANYSGLGYDQIKCRRDTGLILDAVGYDLALGTNYNAVTNGLAYQRASVAYLQSTQQSATIFAIQYVKSSVLALTGVSANGTATTRAGAAFDEIIDILTNGVIQTSTSADVLVWPSPTGGDINKTRAKDQLVANKDFLKAEIIAWLAANYPLVVFNAVLCSRDVGYIIDAITYDILYGGNSASIQVATTYFLGSGAQVLPIEQRAATVAAFNRLSVIAQQVIIKDTVVITSGNVVTQNISNLAGTTVETASVATLVSYITSSISSNSLSALPAPSYPSVTWSAAGLQTAKTAIASARSTIIDNTIININSSYPFTYNQTKCRRDIGLIIDAVTYDVLYGGNSQTADAADEYYSAGTLQVPLAQQAITAATFNYIKSVVASCVVNISITRLNTVATQNTSNPSASAAEATQTNALFDIITNLIINAYTSTVVLEESTLIEIADNAAVSFHQFSLITAAGHTFEWIGAGTNVNTALPYLGGIPIAENQAVTLNQGKIYYTGTDQRGDFRIGDGLVINRNTGTISGRTFTKSLFAVMTPYILAIGA